MIDMSVVFILACTCLISNNVKDKSSFDIYIILYSKKSQFLCLFISHSTVISVFCVSMCMSLLISQFLCLK